MDLKQLFDLSGQVAVVTGGAGGIGEVYAEALCGVGAAVVIADINLDAARNTAKALTDKGFQALAVRLDVTSAESAAEMASATVAAFGGIDILINNAAVMTDLPPYGLSNMPVPDWDRVLNVNLRGPLLCTQAVVESMSSRGGGRVVTKYALHGLTCNLASELGSRGINVNGIAPGLVDNDSAYVSLPKDSPIREILGAQIPGKTSGPPADLVGTMLLLCSPAGEWINGQTISVDGGWIMRF
jgi:NAD(P)-dependent dehydrogenase (short-subunit alcohol dehydrogenase family)